MIIEWGCIRNHAGEKWLKWLKTGIIVFWETLTLEQLSSTASSQISIDLTAPIPQVLISKWTEWNYLNAGDCGIICRKIIGLYEKSWMWINRVPTISWLLKLLNASLSQWVRLLYQGWNREALLSCAQELLLFSHSCPTQIENALSMSSYLNAQNPQYFISQSLWLTRFIFSSFTYFSAN